jgi:hypothetical protein
LQKNNACTAGLWHNVCAGTYITSCVKKLLLTYLTLFVLGFTAIAQQHTIKDLIGKWESTDGGGLEVLDSSRIYLVYGKEQKPIVSYTADFTKKPIWFDFTIKDSTKNLTMKSLMEFTAPGQIRWQVYDDGIRPANFASDRGDLMILKRKN